MSTRVTTRQLDRLQQQLSDRDWRVITMLARVRVATAAQLEAVHFPDVVRRRAQARLAVLTQERVLARLPRIIGGIRAGSRGHVYALDVAGQHLADRAAGRRPTSPRSVGIRFLDHALAVTDVYVGLVRAERAGQLTLERFVGEPSAWRSYFSGGGTLAVLKPDAYVVLGVDGYRDYWFLEVDRATEAISTLERKFAAYRAYAQAGVEQVSHGVFPKVLWLAPDAARAAVIEHVAQGQPDVVREVFVVALQSDAVARLQQGAA